MASRKNRINALDVAAVLVAFAIPAVVIPTATATDANVPASTKAQTDIEAVFEFEEATAGSPLKFTYAEPPTIGFPGVQWTTFVNADGSIPSSVASQHYTSADVSAPTGGVLREFCLTFNPSMGGECYAQSTDTYMFGRMEIGPWQPIMAPSTAPTTDRPDGISTIASQIIGRGNDYTLTVTPTALIMTLPNVDDPALKPTVFTWAVVDPSDVPVMPSAPEVIEDSPQQGN